MCKFHTNATVEECWSKNQETDPSKHDYSILTISYHPAMKVQEHRLDNPRHESVLDRLMVRLALCYQLQRCYATCLLQCPIIKPSIVVHCERPQGDVIQSILAPVHCSMDHERPHSIHHHLDSVCCLCILVLSTKPTKGYSLLLLLTRVTEYLGGENTIVTMVVMDTSMGCFAQPVLKSHFHIFCFSGTQRHLMTTSLKIVPQ